MVGRYPCYSPTFNIGASSHLIPRPGRPCVGHELSIIIIKFTLNIGLAVPAYEQLDCSSVSTGVPSVARRTIVVDNVGIFRDSPVSPFSSHQHSTLHVISYSHPLISSFTSFMVMKSSWFGA